MKNYLCNDMFYTVLFIGYLVYQAAVLHRLSYSTVVILFNSFGRMTDSMRDFSESYPYACETSLYIGRIRQFLNYESKIVSEGDLIPSKEAKDIELKDVSFAYGKNTDMLINGLNLHIRPGEKIALVGYNGAGKTTLVKLLMRLYDVKSGVINADGRNIKEYDVKK